MFIKEEYFLLDEENKHIYLRKATESLRNRIADVIGTGQQLDKELTEVLDEAIKLKRHFRRIQREYSRMEEQLTAIEKESWEIEDITGKTQQDIAGDIIDSMTAIPSLGDILGEYDTKINTEKKKPEVADVPLSSFFDDL